MPSNDKKWFANRGQIIQTAITALALIIGGRNAWQDLMASKFLSPGALFFYVLVGLVLTALFIVWRKGRSPNATQEPHIQKLETKVTFDQGATYKLKVTPLMRNVSGYCVDVKLLKFIPHAIKLSAFPRGTLQVKHPRRGWEPKESDEEIHVPDGNLFHAWIAPDMALSKQDVERSIERIGTLVLLVNNQELSIRV